MDFHFWGVHYISYVATNDISIMETTYYILYVVITTI